MTSTETYIPPGKRRSGLYRRWRVDGYHVQVTWTKGNGRCEICGPRRGFWTVSSWLPGTGIERSQRGDGSSFKNDFHGDGYFCDEHRAPHGTVPDLDYTRHCYNADTDTGEIEHLHPVAGQCGICGAPAHCELWRSCGDDCGEPAHWRESTSRVIAYNQPERTETRRLHDPHRTGEWTRCRAHRDDIPPAGQENTPEPQPPASTQVSEPGETVTVPSGTLQTVMVTIFQQTTRWDWWKPDDQQKAAVRAGFHVLAVLDTKPSAHRATVTLPATDAYHLSGTSNAVTLYRLDETADETYKHPAVEAEIDLADAVREQANDVWNRLLDAEHIPAFPKPHDTAEAEPAAPISETAYTEWFMGSHEGTAPPFPGHLRDKCGETGHLDDPTSIIEAIGELREHLGEVMDPDQIKTRGDQFGVFLELDEALDEAIHELRRIGWPVEREDRTVAWQTFDTPAAAQQEAS